MTLFERLYCVLQCFMPVHHVKVRRLLQRHLAGRGRKRLVDIGGRKSYYTINVNCEVDIVDLPRETELQQALNLGLNDAIRGKIRRHRSNIAAMILEDVTRTTLPDNTYDAAAAVEVIEHIPDDSAFVRQVYRILKPGGFLVLTTPNGETKKNTNPDHVRHYTRAELAGKLEECFEEVDVFYGVRQGFLHRTARAGWWGRKGLRRLTAPWVMLCMLVANVTEPEHPLDGRGFNQLFAVARKAMGGIADG